MGKALKFSVYNKRFRKRSLFKGTVFDSHTRQSDFLGIKQGLFNRKAPDLFYDFLDACKRAWVAKIKKEDER